MSTDIRIIAAHDFIKATPEGQLDFERSRQLLVEIASAAAPLADYEIILDTRKAGTSLSETDLWYLAAELFELRKAFCIGGRRYFVRLNSLTVQRSSRSVPRTEALRSRHSPPSKLRSNG